MATIVNNPGSTTSEDSSAGVVIGVVIALLIIVLFFAFALPYIRNGSTPGAPNTGSTGNDGGSASVNVQLPDLNSNGGSSGNGTNSY